MRMGVGFGSNFCCGIVEIGGFVSDIDDMEGCDASGDTPAELLHDVFRQGDQHRWGNRDSSERGFTYHIWFKKSAKYDGTFSDDQEYEFNELREYIRELPTCLSLGEYINPNTGNMIDGYLFKDENK